MRHDNGTWLTLGVAAAAAGLAALGRRGSRSNKRIPLRFTVKLPGRVTLNDPIETEKDVVVEWDGKPANFPTRAQVLEQFRIDQLHGQPGSLTDAADTALALDTWAYEVAKDNYELEVNNPDEWEVWADSFDIRTIMGGRRVVVDRNKRTLGEVAPTWKDWT